MLGKMWDLENEKKIRYWGTRGEPDLRACWSAIWGVVRPFFIVTGKSLVNCSITC